MAHRRLLALALSFSLVSVASAREGAPAAQTAPATERVAADTPKATPAGATFKVPAGWTITTQGSMVVLEPPETDSHLAIVDVEAKDADAAVGAAWAAFKPDFKRPLKIAQPQAAREGWDERRAYEYETSPNEKATVFALAWRAGKAWTVTLVDASNPTFEKRGGPFSLVSSSLRPKGYARETFAGKKAHAIDAKMIATLKGFLADGMKQLDVAGVAFSLIDGGKVVYEGGLGVKELGRPAPVDADTLFIAASNTKAMTTLLLAELVDEKKLRWDEPVTEAYRAFKLGDAATTKQVLVKHLICACTGLPRQDFEWIFEYAKATPASALGVLGTMQPTSKFGEVFQYSNLMAAAAGFIGGSIVYPGRELGAAYDEAMRTKVFAPLGMKHTTFDFTVALKGDVAQPHGDDVDGKPARARMDPNESIVPVRPAGGVFTSAHDLSKYVQMELAKGALPNGKRLVSEKNLLARRAPQVIVADDVTYGMGLIVDRKWGIPVVHHGGSLFGYKSDMAWLPEHGIGAVILANSDSGWALEGPFLRRLVELLFDGKPEAEEQVRVAAVQRKAAIAKDRERLVVPADAAEAGKLAARYVSTALGALGVKKQGRSVIFDFGEWRSTVASRKNDDGTTSFITIDPSIDGFEFVVADKEGKRALVLRDAQHEYVFNEEVRGKPAAASSGLLVTPDWLVEHRGERNLVLLHVGVPADFEKEHIPGAIPVNPQDLSIPRTEGALTLQLLPPDQLHAKLEGLGIGDDSRVVVYFAKDWVSPTTRVYFSLDAAGLGEKTSILDGGMPAWKAAGGTVVASANDPASAIQRKPGKIAATPHPELVADVDFVKANLNAAGVAIVDSRDTKFFDGAEAGSMPRAGHIPGAHSLPFDALVTDDNRMKSPAETAKLLEAAGVKPGDTVVSYCHIGQQATVVYFAAKRLGYNARLYDGSWDEWSRRPELPVEGSPKP